MNIKAVAEYKLAYFEVKIQHFSNYMVSHQNNIIVLPVPVFYSKNKFETLILKNLSLNGVK